MTDFWIFALVDLVPVVLIITTNPLRGLSRILAPDTLVAAMLFAIFAVRPLYSDRFTFSRDYRGFYGLIPSENGQIAASLIGAILIWSLLIGCVWRNQRRKSSAVHAYDVEPVVAKEQGSNRSRPMLAIVASLAALVAYAGILVATMGLGGFLAIFAGRSDAASTGGLPEVVLTVPLAGSIASAILILSASSSRLSSAERAAVLICTGASLVGVSQLGNRRLIIPAISIVVIAMLMRRSVRLRLWHLATAGLILVALAVLPAVRSAGSRLQNENLVDAVARSVRDVGPLGAAKSFFASYDTEMYDYLAMLAPELQKGRLELGLGSGTIQEFLTHPLPAGMTPGMARSGELRAHLFNYACYGGGCDVPNPVQSLAGTLFLDGWYVAVLIGGIGVGYAVRALSFEWARAAELSVARNIVIAICASYAMIAVRTDTIFALWWCLYTLLIGSAVLIFMGQWSPGGKPQRAAIGGADGLVARSSR